MGGRVASAAACHPPRLWRCAAVQVVHIIICYIAVTTTRSSSSTVVVAAMTWNCRLDFAPPVNITVPTKGSGSGGHRRRLRAALQGALSTAKDAIAMPRYEAGQRRVVAGEEVEQGSAMAGSIGRDDVTAAANRTDGAAAATTASHLFDNNIPERDYSSEEPPTAATMTAATHHRHRHREEVRECFCAVLLPTNATFYCPSPTTNYCSILTRSHNDDYVVSCYEGGNWKVGFARRVWYYLCIVLVLLALYPICTGSGRHALRYLLSVTCCPRMNAWIATQILRSEMEARGRTEGEARRKRQTEGWISGYSLRTKLHSRIADDGVNNAHVVVPAGNYNGNAAPFGAEDADASQRDCDESNNDEEANHNTCTICLLEVEDGERVADLSCGHLYHADCLGQWILKKNSCPLCQNPDIAKQIRSFEGRDDGTTQQGASYENTARRCRRWAREGLLDLLTGRNRHLVHTPAAYA